LKLSALLVITFSFKVRGSQERPDASPRVRKTLSEDEIGEKDETDMPTCRLHRFCFTDCIGLVLYRLRAGSICQEPARLIEAGCGYSPSEAPTAPARPQQKSSEAQGKFRRASLVLVSSHGRDWDDDSDHAGIVGLWKVKFVSKAIQVYPTAR